MKKTVFILLVLLCCGLAWAKFPYGFRAGLNLAKLELSDNGESLDTSSSIGLVLGGFMQFKSQGKLIIQPEVLYTQKGSEANIDDVVTIDYIAVPVLFKLDFPMSSIRLQPFAGPELGYAIKAESTYNPDFLESINKANLGLNLGGDLVYDENYFFGLRYFLGLSDLDKSSAKRPPISNTCWSLSVGYIF